MSHYLKGASHALAPFFIVGILFLPPASSFAGVPVVELQDGQTATSVRAGSPTTTPITSVAAQALMGSTAPAASRQNQLGDLFMQVQQLQQEVQDLRGITEQQNFEIKTLKQQVKDNYIDLDKRLTALQPNVTTPSSVTSTTGANSTDATSTTTPPAASGAEKDSYDAAYQLLEQNHKDEAIAAFGKHLATYPNGDYAANALYWLGQIYLTQGNLPQAEEQFNTLLKNFPNHRKAPDAKFTLGKVYFQQGKKDDAKKIIQEVSQGDSSTAALAKSFLQDNF